MNLAHKIRLYPTIKQAMSLTKACGTARYTWNWALDQWNKEFESGRKPKANDLKKRWNKEKPEWVYESPKDANQQPFTNINTAFKNFFKKTAERPKFKKKGAHESFYLSNDKFKIIQNRVQIPLIGKVKLSEPLRFNGKIISGTISKIADKWFISVCVEGEFGIIEKSKNESIGIDLGVKTSITLSEGEKLEGPKPLKKYGKILSRRSRQHSRKQKGSNNRKKSKIRLARLHMKIANIRKDFLHKITTRLCRENQTITIEDLSVSDIQKNRKLAKAVSDIGMYEFRRQIEYKSKRYGNNLVVADRFFPSTKMCRKCGTKQDIPLSQRTFTCSCGHVEDRDTNAAHNLNTLGLREINACGQNGNSQLIETRTKPRVNLYSLAN